MPDSPVSPELQQLMGDESQVAAVFWSYRDRLVKMVRYRLDSRLAGRIDPDDLLQEVWLDVRRRIDKYTSEPNVPFLLWLRQITAQVISSHHRHHLRTQKRDARREMSLPAEGNYFSGSVSIARHLVGSMSTPSRLVAKEELIEILIVTLNEMEEIDREIIVLRHFEELTNGEAAIELGIEPFTASKRYIRAMKRLTTAMQPVINDGTLDHE